MARLFSSTDQSNSLLALPRPIKTPVLIGLLLASVTTLLTLILFTRLPLEIPLFYSLPEEVQHLVPRQYILIIPGLSFAMFLIHTAIVKYIYSFDKTPALIFVWLTNIGLGLCLFILARLMYIL